MPEELSPLEYAIRRLGYIWADGYLARLLTFEENVWHQPTNAGSSDYDVFRWFEEQGLVQVQTVPIWKAGGFRGQQRWFRYRRDLNYEAPAERKGAGLGRLRAVSKTRAA